MSTAAVEDLEQRLRSQLARCRLVFELGLDKDLYKEIVQAIAALIRENPGHLHRLGKRFPALLVSYLVAEGIHSYEAGAYWPRLSIPPLRGLGASLGTQFDEALAALGLPGFEELVQEDKAKRWLSRILIHGGIPRYSLNDFFRLLLSSLKGGPGQAVDLVAMWRSRKTRFQGIDKPVERFLLRGGEVALDLLDRCLEMILEERRTGVIPKREELGLPEYVVDAYASLPWQERRSVRPASAIPRPRVELDPWDPFGPRLSLPPVPEKLAGAEWHINDGAQVIRIRGRPDRAERTTLDPAFAWTVSLWRGHQRHQELTFEGLEEIPLLLFDPGSGRMVASRQIVKFESVWALHPREGFRLTRDAEGQAMLRVREDFPDLAGRWHGYVRRHYELEEVSQIYAHWKDREPWLIRVAQPSQRPRLSGDAVDAVTTLEGYAVYATPPSLEVPAVPGMTLADWTLAIRWQGGSWQRSVAEIPRDADGRHELRSILDDTVPDGVVKVTLRGPLGSDLREEFVLIRGLSVERPTTPLLPSDPPAKVRLSLGPRDSRGEWRCEVKVPSGTDEAMVPIPTPHGGEIRVRVTVPRVLWSLDRIGDPRSSFGGEILTASMDDILDGSASALSVRTRVPGARLVLSLVDGGQVLQRFDPVTASGAEGRWTFELAPFVDTLRTSGCPVLFLELEVDGRSLRVARVVARLVVDAISATWKARGPDQPDEANVLLTFSEERPLRNRVARLWSLNRPWDPPYCVQISDDVENKAEFERVAFGRYLAEIAIDDGWSRPSRPAIGSMNTRLVSIGTDEDRARRAARLDLGSPYAVLEAAVTSDRPLRPLTREELREVGAAAIDLLTLLLEEHGHRALTIAAFDRVTSLLLDDPASLLESLAALEDSRGLALRAAICLLRPIKERGPEVDEAVIRELWAVCPPLAAVLDVPRTSYDDRAAARVEEHLGGPTGEGRSWPFVGGPVELPFASMERDRVTEIRLAMSLIPRRWLDSDSLAIAYLEWIEARFERPSVVEAWCERHLDLLDTSALPQLVWEAISRRRPAPQGPDWFIFPQLTLSAATHLVLETARADQATAALVEAVPFGSRLVTRDILFACVLEHLCDE